jgi:hypothetical protein
MSVLAKKFYLLFRVVPGLQLTASVFGVNLYSRRGLLLYPQNRVLYSLGDTKFDDRLRRNLDLLLRLWIHARARFPLLLHKFAKTGQDKFASFFNLFVSERAKSIEEYSRGSFVGLCGSGKCALKFVLGHL